MREWRQHSGSRRVAPLATLGAGDGPLRQLHQRHRGRGRGSQRQPRVRLEPGRHADLAPQQIAGPGSTTSAPAIVRFANSIKGTEVAAKGPNGSLEFYWNQDDIPTLHPSQINGPFSTTSAPAMVRFPNGTEIAVEGPGGSLHFYWNRDDTPTWHLEQITGAFDVFSAPAIVRSFDSTEVAFTPFIAVE